MRILLFLILFVQEFVLLHDCFPLGHLSRFITILAAHESIHLSCSVRALQGDFLCCPKTLFFGTFERYLKIMSRETYTHFAKFVRAVSAFHELLIPLKFPAPASA